MRKLLFIAGLALLSCSEINKESIEHEVELAEAQFEKMAESDGVAEAFLFFAAEDAVLNRNNTLIKGKSAIKAYFIEHDYSKVKLNWKPDYIDVAESGDLAYTYGRYILRIVDSIGNTTSSECFFHTVWRKQADGTWKYVWD